MSKKKMYLEKLLDLWKYNLIGGIIGSIVFGGELNHWFGYILGFLLGSGAAYLGRIFRNHFGTWIIYGNIVYSIAIYGFGLIIGMMIGTPILLILTIYYMVCVVINWNNKDINSNV